MSRNTNFTPYDYNYDYKKYQQKYTMLNKPGIATREKSRGKCNIGCQILAIGIIILHIGITIEITLSQINITLVGTVVLV